MNRQRWLLATGFFIACLLISACAASPDEQSGSDRSSPEEEAAIAAEIPEEEPTTVSSPEPTSKPPMLATLESAAPDFEIFFDGVDCTVEGPGQAAPGEIYFVLDNTSGVAAVLWVGHYLEGGSFEGHRSWREENDCGNPGDRCENEDGNSISYPEANWLNAVKQAQEGTQVYYKVYDLTRSVQHFIYIGSNNGGWLCVPFDING